MNLINLINLFTFITLFKLIPTIQAQSSSSSNIYNPLPTLEAFSFSEQSVFYINTTIGTPPQQNILRLDICEPYLWVISSKFRESYEEEQNSSSNSAQLIPISFLQPHFDTGVYTIENSNSSIDLNDWQTEVFLNYITVNGSIVQDDITINDFKIDNLINKNLSLNDMNFINANYSNAQVGSFGLSGRIKGELTNYNMYFTEMLKTEGLIKSVAYSHYPKNHTALELVFGGVNPNHFDNKLVQFSNIPFSDGTNLYYNYPIVPLTSMSVKSESGGSALLFDETQALPVLLNSRSIYTSLPLNTVINLAIQLNAYYSEQYNSWFVKCSIGDLNAKISFQFGNLTIDVPVSSMIREIHTDARSVYFDDGEKACDLGVIPAFLNGYYTLGINVLRSSYFVVDNENNQIALAQANNQLWQSMQNFDSSTSIETTTTDLPLESSIIQSQTIPFAVANNVTTSMTLSFITNSSDTPRIPPEVSARITGSTIYTGRFSNTSSPCTSTSSKGSANQLVSFDWSSIRWFGVILTLTLFFFGVVL